MKLDRLFLSLFAFSKIGVLLHDATGSSIACIWIFLLFWNLIFYPPCYCWWIYKRFLAQSRRECCCSPLWSLGLLLDVYWQLSAQWFHGSFLMFSQAILVSLTRYILMRSEGLYISALCTLSSNVFSFIFHQLNNLVYLHKKVNGYYQLYMQVIC